MNKKVLSASRRVHGSVVQWLELFGAASGPGSDQKNDGCLLLTTSAAGYRRAVGLNHAGRSWGPWGESPAVGEVLEMDFGPFWDFRDVAAEA